MAGIDVGSSLEKLAEQQARTAAAVAFYLNRLWENRKPDIKVTQAKPEPTPNITIRRKGSNNAALLEATQAKSIAETLANHQKASQSLTVNGISTEVQKRSTGEILISAPNSSAKIAKGKVEVSGDREEMKKVMAGVAKELAPVLPEVKTNEMSGINQLLASQYNPMYEVKVNDREYTVGKYQSGQVYVQTDDRNKMAFNVGPGMLGIGGNEVQEKGSTEQIKKDLPAIEAQLAEAMPLTMPREQAESATLEIGGKEYEVIRATDAYIVKSGEESVKYADSGEILSGASSAIEEAVKEAANQSGQAIDAKEEPASVINSPEPELQVEESASSQMPERAIDEEFKLDKLIIPETLAKSSEPDVIEEEPNELEDEMDRIDRLAEEQYEKAILAEEQEFFKDPANQIDEWSSEVSEEESDELNDPAGHEVDSEDIDELEEERYQKGIIAAEEKFERETAMPEPDNEFSLDTLIYPAAAKDGAEEQNPSQAELPGAKPEESAPPKFEEVEIQLSTYEDAIALIEAAKALDQEEQEDPRKELVEEVAEDTEISEEQKLEQEIIYGTTKDGWVDGLDADTAAAVDALMHGELGAVIPNGENLEITSGDKILFATNEKGEVTHNVLITEEGLGNDPKRQQALGISRLQASVALHTNAKGGIKVSRLNGLKEKQSKLPKTVAPDSKEKPRFSPAIGNLYSKVIKPGFAKLKPGEALKVGDTKFTRTAKKTGGHSYMAEVDGKSKKLGATGKDGKFTPSVQYKKDESLQAKLAELVKAVVEKPKAKEEEKKKQDSVSIPKSAIGNEKAAEPSPSQSRR